MSGREGVDVAGADPVALYRDDIRQKELRPVAIAKLLVFSHMTLIGGLLILACRNGSED
jgi:hypothetical protein